jgi:aerotaxis receptor
VALRGGAAAGLAGTTLAAFAGGIAGGGLLAAWWLQAQVAAPIEQMRAQALRMASGDTSNSLHMNRVDEIGITTRAIGQLGLMFRWIIDDVNGQVMNVQTATNEIAQGNDDLSARTEQAAASVEETASSMEQMTATVKNNADTARVATELSGGASDAAVKGGQAVAAVVATMNDISNGSRRISDIIGVIDGIAFQTNILALNAAVEAARAGEQGRGFAVVAAEVRSLAQRSADAAREIKGLITASVERVSHGSTLVDRAGETMSEIVDSIQRVTNIMGEISAASTEQSAGVGQVGEAVSQMDQALQQNAALVEESAAAAESLSQQAKRLVGTVAVFKLNGALAG